MRRALISCSFLWLCSIVHEGAAATLCNDIYPDARIGPPPEWTFWADGSACYVRWTVGSPDDENKLLERCRSTPGSRFVHFERSKGTAQSICLFKILDMANAPTMVPSREGATGNEEKALDDAEALTKVPAPDELAPSASGPDPDRLVATVTCSSIKLGNYKHCIGPPQSIGEGQFIFRIQEGCREGAMAAIAIMDAKGRCVRRVTVIPPNGRSAALESFGTPSVLDAIRFQPDVFQCYARRHDNISCDGNTDYSDPRASSNIVVNLAAVESPTVSKPVTKATKAHKKQISRKKTWRKKVVATASVSNAIKERTVRKKWKPKEKRKPACFTTIWQCSPPEAVQSRPTGES